MERRAAARTRAAQVGLTSSGGYGGRTINQQPLDPIRHVLLAAQALEPGLNPGTAPDPRRGWRDGKAGPVRTLPARADVALALDAWPLFGRWRCLRTQRSCTSRESRLLLEGLSGLATTPSPPLPASPSVGPARRLSLHPEVVPDPLREACTPPCGSHRRCSRSRQGSPRIRAGSSSSSPRAGRLRGVSFEGWSSAGGAVVCFGTVQALVTRVRVPPFRTDARRTPERTAARVDSATRGDASPRPQPL